MHEAFQQSLKLRIGDNRYATWFGDAVCFEVEESSIRLLVNTPFERDRIRRQFLQEIQDAAKEVLGESGKATIHVAEAASLVVGTPAVTSQAQTVGSSSTVVRSPRLATVGTTSAAVTSAASSQAIASSNERAHLRFEAPHAGLRIASVPGESTSTDALAAGSAQSKPVTARPKSSTMNPFAEWVEGSSNAEATRVSRRLAAGDPMYGHAVCGGPIIIWGPPGTGKTHLLKAISGFSRKHNRRRRVRSLTAEQFLVGFVEAIRGGGLPSFRQKHRGVELLLIDDVQLLLGKMRTVEELQQTLDALAAEGAQVIFTSDRSPAELASFGPEFASRIAGGLSLQIGLPEHSLREELIRRAAKQRQLPLSNATVTALATHLTGGAREVSGALNRMMLLHDTFGNDLNESLAERAAADTNRLATPPVRLPDIQAAVCEVFGVDAASLRSNKRSKAIAEPRMLAMWLSRKMTGSAWSEIADYFNRSSHSTVISAHRRVEKMLAEPEPAQLSSAAGSNLSDAIRRVEAALRMA